MRTLYWETPIYGSIKEGYVSFLKLTAWKATCHATVDDKFHRKLENLFLNVSIIWPSIVTICLLTRCFFSLCTISSKNSGERTHWGRNIRGNPETFSPSCMHVRYHEGLLRRGQCHDHVDLVQTLYPPSATKISGFKVLYVVRCSSVFQLNSILLACILGSTFLILSNHVRRKEMFSF